jgi:hypothetical protein
MTKYTNFNESCAASGYTQNSDNCKGSVAKACRSQLIKDGYEDINCKTWCIANPTDCLASIKEWCNDANFKNSDKPICSCFNDEKFTKYKEQFNCKDASCKISGYSPGCFFPACITSGMANVSNANAPCPSNLTVYQTCVNDLTAQSGGSVDAGTINQVCQLTAGNIDGDTGGVLPDGGTGPPGSTTQPPLLDYTTPPLPPTDAPPAEEEKQSFFDQYKWYIIGGGVGLVLILILVAVAFAVNKS